MRSRARRSSCRCSPWRCPFESLGHLLSRAIYATHHTVLQVVASLIGFAITVGATLALVPTLDVLAIPAGYALGVTVRCVLLAFVLVGRIRRMPVGSALAQPPT